MNRDSGMGWKVYLLTGVLFGSSWAVCAEEGVTVENWGSLKNGEKVKLITLNRGDANAKIATYGAQIVELNIPVGEEKLRNVVLGHPDVETAENKGTLGAVIGRYANRISNGGFTIDGKRYELESVNQKSGIQIHGGKTGFHRQNWEIEPDPVPMGFSKVPSSITLKLRSADGHEGFPGNVMVWVQYRLSEITSDVFTSLAKVPEKPIVAFEMEFRAETDQPTHINLTNHAYFNLEGSGTILGHLMWLPKCERILEFDERKIPTGKIESVTGTRFDYRKCRRVGPEAGETFEGIDHCFVVPDGGKFGYLQSPGLSMSIETTQPGVQIYTANHFKENPFPRFGAICFETQHYPDTPNRSEFPSTLLRPGEWLVESTSFRFTRPLF